MNTHDPPVSANTQGRWKVNIDAVKLEKVMAMPLLVGSHQSIERGLCILEAVSYVAGEKWSDHPQCASPVIAAFLRSWNDRLPDDERQSLKQYIPLLVGSRGSAELERRRSWMMTDWVVRDSAPRWLRRAGMSDKADMLAGLPEITNSEGYAPIKPALLAIRDECWEKRRGWCEKLVAAVKEKVGKTAAYAAADADAAAYADADAAAAAYAAAYAAADADAAAAAYAAAAADAAADADAGSRWDKIYSAVKAKLLTIYREKFKDTRAESQASAHALVTRLLEVS